MGKDFIGAQRPISGVSEGGICPEGKEIYRCHGLSSQGDTCRLLVLFLPAFYPINCSSLPSPGGVNAFHTFLKTEFSEENLDFWLACEDFKKTRSKTKLASKANRIFEEFVQNEAPREVRAFSVAPNRMGKE